MIAHVWTAISNISWNICHIYNSFKSIKFIQDTNAVNLHFVSVDKRFTIAASSAWNTLSLPIRQITNIDTFKKHLKPFFLLNSVLFYVKVLLVFSFLFLFVNCKRCDAAVNSAI